MRKIAIALSKEGVGKATTATTLAYGLAQKGKAVLLVDCDTQRAGQFFSWHQAGERPCGSVA